VGLAWILTTLNFHAVTLSLIFNTMNTFHTVFVDVFVMWVYTWRVQATIHGIYSCDKWDGGSTSAYRHFAWDCNLSTMRWSTLHIVKQQANLLHLCAHYLTKWICPFSWFHVKEWNIVSDMWCEVCWVPVMLWMTGNLNVCGHSGG